MTGVRGREVTGDGSAGGGGGDGVGGADEGERGDGDEGREVVRGGRPGTVLETSDDDARYLAAVVREEGATGATADADADGPYGLAFADVTTGRCVATTGADGGDLRA